MRPTRWSTRIHMNPRIASFARHLTRRRTLIAIAIVLILAGGGALLAKKRAAASTAAIASAAGNPANTGNAAGTSTLEFLAGDIMRVTPQPLRRVLPLSGALRAIDQATVKARVAGEIRVVHVREGEAVRAGQVLVEMDQIDFRSRLDQAKGALLAQQGNLDIATQTRTNNQRLVDKGFISRNAFDNAASQYDIAKANLDSARGALAVAQKALSDTVVKAPIDGLISSRAVEPGETVPVDATLLKVVDLRKIEMEAPVPTADILNVKLGQIVTVTVEGLPTPLTGTVARINPATETGSRSIMVYVRIDNPDGLLRAGMFGQALLTLATRDEVLSVPPTAIQEVGGIRCVYLIRDGKLVQQPVTLGMRGADNAGANAVEVVSGLQNGDQLVKNNLGTLQDGIKVRIVGTPAVSPAAISATPPAGHS